VLRLLLLLGCMLRRLGCGPCPIIAVLIIIFKHLQLV
jgi:hypothetical protein